MADLLRGNDPRAIEYGDAGTAHQDEVAVQFLAKDVDDMLDRLLAAGRQACT